MLKKLEFVIFQDVVAKSGKKERLQQYMDSFWIKIGILGAIAIGLIILVKTLKPSLPEPQFTGKSF